MRLLPVLMALTVLPACFSGLNSKAPLQQRYVLRPALPPARPGPPDLGATVEVLRATGAPGLAGEGIAVLRPGARLDFYSNARWAADAPAAQQSLVIESLRGAGRFATVESESAPFAARFVLSLELEHFEAVYGPEGPPTIQVALFCSLGRRSDRNMIVSFLASSSVPAQADRMQAVMAAFEQATSEALSQIAANIVPPTALPGTAAP